MSMIDGKKKMRAYSINEDLLDLTKAISILNGISQSEYIENALIEKLDLLEKKNDLTAEFVKNWRKAKKI
jgi:hypothetical protein